MQNRGKKRQHSEIKNSITVDRTTTLEIINADHLQDSHITTAILGDGALPEIVAKLPECITTVIITNYTKMFVLDAIPEHVKFAILKPNCEIKILRALQEKNIQIITLDGDRITVTPKEEAEELELEDAAEELHALSKSGEIAILAEIALSEDATEPTTKKQRTDDPTPVESPAETPASSLAVMPASLGLPMPAAYSQLPFQAAAPTPASLGLPMPASFSQLSFQTAASTPMSSLIPISFDPRFNLIPLLPLSQAPFFPFPGIASAPMPSFQPPAQSYPGLLAQAMRLFAAPSQSAAQPLPLPGFNSGSTQ